MIAWSRLRATRDRALEVRRLLGLSGAVITGARWLVQRKFLVFARDLTETLPEAPTDPVRWTPLDPSHLAALSALVPAVPVAEIRRRWREGQHAEGGWDGDRLVYVRWEARGSTHVPYLGCRLRLLPTDLLVIEEFTHPQARGRGISTVASLRSLRRAREAGCRRSLALVAWWNVPAIRVTRDRMGRRLVGTLGYWNLVVTRRYFASGAARLERDGVALGAAAAVGDLART
jgi:GNAT superfamily N-acetyltransferase